tara:strand:- start:1168 stop:1482 length:315 start_codon:yes stop_codon:yes gene_type:complete
MKDIVFLLEIQKLAVQMDNLVEKYEMRDRFVSVLVSGFINEEEDGTIKMNAIYSYHIDNFMELSEILDFIDNTYEEEDDDDPDTFQDFNENMDNLLGDLGIDTE